MKKFLSFLFVLFFSVSAGAQVEDPVEWEFKSESLGNNEYMLIMKASVEKGWYIYSQDIDDGGPIPTSVNFNEPVGFELIGETEEKGRKIEKYDELFKMDIAKYSKRMLLRAKVKVTQPEAVIRGYVEYMACDDGHCTPPLDERFEYKLTAEVGGDEASTGAKSTGILEPVKWEFDHEVLGDDEVALIFSANIDKGWWVYSQHTPQEDGKISPVPTTFTFNEDHSYELLGEVKEKGNLREAEDKVFDMVVKKFKKKVDFVANVKLKNPQSNITGSFNFMTCDDTKCLPPEDVKFGFEITKSVENGKDQYAVTFVPDPNSFSGSGSGGEQVTSAGEGGDSTEGENKPKPDAISENDKKLAGEISKLIADCGKDIPKSADSDTEGKGLWVIFILGFLGGFAALLTPCVFPMIPLTVSFFTKRSKTRHEGIRNAFIYALSIIVIYVSLGYLVTILFGADALNALSTDPWFNLFFFAIFVVFAISFFGYFEITLPNWLVNKSDAASDRGGLIGIFFMAFTLALVSFSCTGPIIGTLLVEAASTGATMGPVMGMTGFAVALALPFALFAAFPGWLNSMPKSGGWLNSVKVVLGFIELIFAVKFLSNADLVLQLGLIKLETFYIIWIILFAAMGLYLFNLIRFNYDVKIPFKQLSKIRIALGAISIAFAIYLIPGIFCQERSLVSGFPPPTFYSYGCHTYHIQDLGEAQELARKEGKPVLVDFTGWACVNCRKMETNVWTLPQIAKLMDQYIIASLYVDEKIELPENEHFKYRQGDKIKHVTQVGNKWSFLTVECLETNTQPFYALLNDDGKLLNTPVGYTPNADQYAQFLQEGLDNYEKGTFLIE